MACDHPWPISACGGRDRDGDIIVLAEDRERYHEFLVKFLEQYPMKNTEESTTPQVREDT